MLTFRQVSTALLITTLSSLSWAQTTSTRPTPDTTVGVPSSEAREAMERAQRRDAEASVIRTDESAAQRARDAVGTLREGAADVGNRASNAARDTVAPDRNVGTRAPRADRN